jgi:hypothetical protein
VTSKLLAIGVIAGGMLAAQAPQPQPPPPEGVQEPSQEPAKEYQGPTILSRDKSLIGERGGKLLDFRFYGEIMGAYDTGLTSVGTDAQGNLARYGSNYSAQGGVGVVGSREWRRDKLSLEYHGSGRHYTSNSFFDGTDQYLNLSYAHALSRRLTLDLKETLGTLSLSNGALTYAPLTNTDLFAVPANELFDNRTEFVQSRVDVNWQKTARLSFSVGGSGFIVKRRSQALAGVTGGGGRADVAYRLTRRQTVSLNYGYTSYNYTRTFGDSNLHSIAAGWSVGLGRVWNLGFQGGIIRAETRGLQNVTLDPAIASIVGQSQVVTTYHRIQLVPLVEGQLVRRFPRSTLALAYGVGVTPGNGVYLTSRQNVGSVSYSYIGTRRFTAGATASYGQLSSVGQGIGKYTNLQGGLGATYKLFTATHLEVRYDYRHYTTQSAKYTKDAQRVTVGIAFSPGETPLSLW